MAAMSVLPKDYIYDTIDAPTYFDFAALAAQDKAHQQEQDDTTGHDHSPVRAGLLNQTLNATAWFEHHQHSVVGSPSPIKAPAHEQGKRAKIASMIDSEVKPLKLTLGGDKATAWAIAQAVQNSKASASKKKNQRQSTKSQASNNNRINALHSHHHVEKKKNKTGESSSRKERKPLGTLAAGTTDGGGGDDDNGTADKAPVVQRRKRAAASSISSSSSLMTRSGAEQKKLNNNSNNNKENAANQEANEDGLVLKKPALGEQRRARRHVRAASVACQESVVAAASSNNNKRRIVRKRVNSAMGVLPVQEASTKAAVAPASDSALGQVSEEFQKQLEERIANLDPDIKARIEQKRREREAARKLQSVEEAVPAAPPAVPAITEEAEAPLTKVQPQASEKLDGKIKRKKISTTGSQAVLQRLSTHAVAREQRLENLRKERSNPSVIPVAAESVTKQRMQRLGAEMLKQREKARLFREQKAREQKQKHMEQAKRLREQERERKRKERSEKDQASIREKKRAKVEKGPTITSNTVSDGSDLRAKTEAEEPVVEIPALPLRTVRPLTVPKEFHFATEARGKRCPCCNKDKHDHEEEELAKIKENMFRAKPVNKKVFAAPAPIAHASTISLTKPVGPTLSTENRARKRPLANGTEGIELETKKDSKRPAKRQRIARQDSSEQSETRKNEQNDA